MRWIVEVSSLGKTDLQKFCVEAESWQRALQAARAQRGEEGPMSGFSIELLEEGYRAVDPLARIRFVVKRAPDDTPITAPLAKDAKAGVAPSPQSTVAATAAATTDTKTAPATLSSPPPATKSVPPRPGDKVANAPASQKAVAPSAEATTKGTSPISKPTSGAPPASAASGASAPAAPTSAAVPPAGSASAPPAVGSALPGLPAVKVLSAREQDPTDASPLTYREYSFVVPAGTSEEVAAEVLRGQLKLVDAHLANAKMGKLVNLAVFDVEFTGKPPAPVATLTWKDWKGAPVIGYPRRGTGQKQVKPPSSPPPALQGTAAPASAFPPPSSRPPAPVAVSASQPPAAPFPLQSPFPLSPSSMPPPAPFASPMPAIPQALLPQQHQAPAATQPASVPPPAQPAPLAAPSAPPPAPVSAPPPAPFSAPPPALASVPPPPPPVVTPSQPPPAVIPAPVIAPAAVFQPATQGVAPPAFFEMPVAAVEPAPAANRGSSPDGMVRTPSGRFVRGRTTGDELITALFESMHDLHFLRDALDGGQFCLALATEVLPARAAIIHFFDVEKREWVVACTRGKDTSRLLTLRTPESDELLRVAARVRRAVVTANATETATAHRYESLGGTRSMIIAPIMQAGRALGAIEIINPLDGMPFTDDEGNAMTYIAEQYAEYLGSRGIVLDRERIQAAATR